MPTTAPRATGWPAQCMMRQRGAALPPSRRSRRGNQKITLCFCISSPRLCGSARNLLFLNSNQFRAEALRRGDAGAVGGLIARGQKLHCRAINRAELIAKKKNYAFRPLFSAPQREISFSIHSGSRRGAERRFFKA